MAQDEASGTTYEELAALEDEYDEVDQEIMRTQYFLSRPIYARRAAAIARIPNFWALVLEQAPLELDRYISPTDNHILNDSLLSLSVTRPHLDAEPPTGHARSFCVRFEFAENEVFEDRVLEKWFWFRRARDDWTGLVSEPVRIKWRKGRDTTEGLTERSAALFEARRKVGDWRSRELPEYRALEAKVRQFTGSGTSFFTWFGWVSSRRFVSAEESEEANREYKRRKEARLERGWEALDESLRDEGDGEDDQDVEVHEAGEEIAVAIAEDVFPGAIKYFTQAMEVGEVSDADFEEDDDGLDVEESEDEPVDIRALAQQKGGKARSRDEEGPPPKKRAKK